MNQYVKQGLCFLSITGSSFCICVYFEDIRNYREGYLLGELILLQIIFLGIWINTDMIKSKVTLSLRTNMQWQLLLWMHCFSMWNKWSKIYIFKWGKAFLFPHRMKPKILSLLVSKRSQSSKQPLVKSDCSVHNHAFVASVKGQSLDQIFCALVLETETENCFQDIVFGCFKQSQRHGFIWWP